MYTYINLSRKNEIELRYSTNRDKSLFAVLEYQPKLTKFTFMRLDNQCVGINEEIICTLSEIKPLTYPVLSRSTLGVDLVTLSNPVVLGLCFLSENSLSPLVSYVYV